MGKALRKNHFYAGLFFILLPYQNQIELYAADFIVLHRNKKIFPVFICVQQQDLNRMYFVTKYPDIDKIQ